MLKIYITVICVSFCEIGELIDHILYRNKYLDILKDNLTKS